MSSTSNYAIACFAATLLLGTFGTTEPLAPLKAIVAIPLKNPQSYDCNGIDASFALLRKSISNYFNSSL